MYKAILTGIAAASLVSACATTTPSPRAGINPFMQMSMDMTTEFLVEEIPAVGAQKAKDCQSVTTLVGLAQYSDNAPSELKGADAKIGMTVAIRTWGEVLKREAAAEGIEPKDVKSDVIKSITTADKSLPADERFKPMLGQMESCFTILNDAIGGARERMEGLKPGTEEPMGTET